LLEISHQAKAEGFSQEARDYEYYLTTFPNLSLMEMDLRWLEKASDLRAAERIKDPDAIQLATASSTARPGSSRTTGFSSGLKKLTSSSSTNY